MVGRISPEKGQATAVEAVAGAIARGHDVALRLVGPEDRDYGPIVRSTAERLTVSNAIELTGEQDDPAAHYRENHVLIVASRSEAFGRITMEAFRAGRPVVGAASGGTLELVTPGVNGELFTPGDAAGLAAHLERLADDRTYLERLATGARESAARNLLSGDRVLELLREAAGA